MGYVVRLLFMRNNAMSVEPVAEPVCEIEKAKPPLGIKPERLWLESRRDDIYAAITRYRDAGYAVPVHWLNELCAIEGILQS
jgi:hypothetical protein